MLDSIFRGLFDAETATVISVTDFLLCVGVSLAIGAFLALIYTYKNRCTKSFVITLAMIPVVVCVVIMMVNGNIGAGVAVAGTFGLVRFRSVPGTAKEICSIFLAMGTGLVAGMGYLGYAGLFALILGAVHLFYTWCRLGETKKPWPEKTLRITIPEDLDYQGVFDDILQEYTASADIVAVKTTNMGSMFKLTYHVKLKSVEKEKEFIDRLRCRNGNLEISISVRETAGYEL